MIVWINGAYGSGKSTAAHMLVSRIPGAQHFSAELVGDAVRENIKELCYHVEYPDYPIWRTFVRELLLEMAKLTDKPIFIPMTVLKEAYIRDIFDFLEENGVTCRHFVLDTPAEVALDRILARGEEADCWCARQAERCAAALKDIPGIHIDAEKSAEEVAEEILAQL